MLGFRFACGLSAVLYFSLAHVEARGDEPLICGTAWVSTMQSRGNQLAERRVELFDAVADGQIDVELIAPSAREVWLRVTNKTNDPLRIKLPDAFAAVPVLGQFAPMGNIGWGAQNNFGPGGNLGNFGNPQRGLGQGQGLGGQGQGGQGLGGGFNNGGNGGGNFGGGNFGGGGNMFGNGGGNFMGNGAPGGIFRVPPGRTGKVRAQTVCLEHGKPEPNSRMRYHIVPLEEFNNDARIARLCQYLARHEISQNVAQAAAWHITNGLSWEELAHKDRVQSKYTGNQKFFSSEELELAIRAVEASQEGPSQSSETSTSAEARPVSALMPPESTARAAARTASYR